MIARAYQFPACRRMGAISGRFVAAGWAREDVETFEAATIIQLWLGASITPRVLDECIRELLIEHEGEPCRDPVTRLRVRVVERQAQAALAGAQAA